MIRVITAFALGANHSPSVRVEPKRGEGLVRFAIAGSQHCTENPPRPTLPRGDRAALKLLVRIKLQKFPGLRPGLT